MDGSIPGWKPGLYYGADEQCKIAFGSVATACTFADSNVVGRKFLSCWGQRGNVLELRCKERELETKGLKVLFCLRFLGKEQTIKGF